MQHKSFFLKPLVQVEVFVKVLKDITEKQISLRIPLEFLFHNVFFLKEGESKGNMLENENLLEEYRVLNKAVESRWSSALLADSILIPSSVLVVMFAIEHKELIGIGGFYNLPTAGFKPILSALLLVIIPYFTHYSTIKLNEKYFERIHEIEEELKIKGHHQIEDHLKNPWRPWWYSRRYNMGAWHFFFWALILIYVHTALWIFLR